MAKDRPKTKAKSALPRIVDARHVASIDAPDGYEATRPEIAFCGRSNVGKSSLLNALCNRHRLAHTSKTPGRTQRIHLYDIRLADGTELRLADLPGYGHARVSGHLQRTFGPMIENYLKGRQSLVAVNLLVDARRKPDQDAINFALWMQEREIHAELVVTKIDKVPRNRRFDLLHRLGKGYGIAGEPIATSATEGIGIDQLWRRLSTLAAQQGGPPARGRR